MRQNRLFRQTRLRLATWYAGVMGAILGLCGLGVYEGIAHAHRMTLHREVASVAGTLHDSLEPMLVKSDIVEADILPPQMRRLLPDLCVVGDSCADSQGNLAFGQGEYYVRLRDRTGQLVATAGIPPQTIPSVRLSPEFWQDAQGTRYYQIALEIGDWGELEVGRSLQDWDDYMRSVGLILGLGLPVALLVVGTASWGLAGIAMKPIYRSYRQIQQFTGDAAHELRTPLAAIQATVESTLRLPHLGETEARETLQILDRQNHRLSQLVRDLLWLSRMEQQELPPKRECCCLDDLASDVEEELAALAIQGKIELQVETASTQPVCVRGNEAQLYRLIHNLTSNAIAYTPAGGKVTISLESTATDAIVRVLDTGIGIAPAEQARIFDRFYRVSGDRARNRGGSGLGLAIVRAIAEAHQGNVRVESELGKGSTFIVSLPRVR